MGTDSKIEWTKHTWNPWIGCIKVSPGCKNCYMYRERKQYGQVPAEIVRTKPNTFSKPITWNNEDPGLVFTSSWTDFFLEEVPYWWRHEAWKIIRSTPRNTYQILTKRIESVPYMLPEDWGDGWPNVWLGVSVENQEMANKRIPQLLSIPASVHFLSCEPLLGPIDLTRSGAVEKTFRVWVGQDKEFGDREEAIKHGLVDWVIVGGESGYANVARPMYPDWAVSLLVQCQVADIPFFFKQWGRWGVYAVTDSRDGKSRVMLPDGTFSVPNWDSSWLRRGDAYVMYPYGKNKAGNKLHGGWWSQMPKVWEDG